MPLPPIPSAWRATLKAETSAPSWTALAQFVDAERATFEVFPPAPETFTALKLTAPAAVRVVILGQDPYPGPGQAHGLAFSVRPGVKPPASLRNIFKEMHDDLGTPMPNNGSLVPWARQGVLLLNAVLTVRAGHPNSHKGKGWERFTDAVIRRVNEQPHPVVFVLWGGFAQKKLTQGLIDPSRHPVITSAHPSPLSAHHGFFGSRPFSRVNAALRAAKRPEIDWTIPDL